MATLTADIKTYLGEAPHALTFIRRGSFPDTPNACIAIYEYPGIAPDMVFGKEDIDTEYPRIQIAVRGEPDDYDEPRSRAETAYRALAKAPHRLISGTRYLELKPLQPPFVLTKDENLRWIWAFNVQITKGLSA